VTTIDRLKLTRTENRHSKPEAGIAKLNDECYAAIHSAFNFAMYAESEWWTGDSENGMSKILKI